jgi:hypothetical protein
MDLVRYTRDVYGQETLEGISWDLLPVAIGLGVLVIIGHAVYRLVRGKRES